ELAAALESSLARQGISAGRLRILAQLMDQGRPATHSELAQWSGVTNGTITGLVDGLEREGYVRREPSPDDRRVVMIALTPAGLAHVKKILPDHLTRLARLMSGLTKAQQRTLVQLLLKV